MTMFIMCHHLACAQAQSYGIYFSVITISTISLKNGKDILLLMSSPKLKTNYDDLLLTFQIVISTDIFLHMLQVMVTPSYSVETLLQLIGDSKNEIPKLRFQMI